jgi:hypothetical protein
MLWCAGKVPFSFHRPVVLSTWIWELNADELTFRNMYISDVPNGASAAIGHLDDLADFERGHGDAGARVSLQRSCEGQWRKWRVGGRSLVAELHACLLIAKLRGNSSRKLGKSVQKREQKY